MHVLKSAVGSFFLFLLLSGSLCLCSHPLFAGASDTVYVKQLLKQSTALQRIDPDSCELLARDALRISEKLHYRPGIRGAYVRIGSVLMTRGENDAALPYIREALSIDIADGQFKGAAGACVLLGYIYEAKGQEDSAFRVLFDAIRYSELAGDSATLILIYTTLGDLKDTYQEPEAAVYNYEYAIRIAKALESSDGLLSAWMGIGNVRYKQGNHDLALRYYLLVDSVSRIEKNVITTAQNLNNIALCYASLHATGTALKYYGLALAEYVRFDMASEAANVSYNIGDLYLSLGQTDSAVAYLEQAVRQSRVLGELNRTAAGYDLLSKAYALGGDFETAYRIRLMHSSLRDSLLTTEKIASISEMETKYKTAQKETQLNLLQTRFQARQRQRNLLIGGSIGLLLISIVLVFQRNRLRKARNRSNKLLLNILPAEVAEELKATGGAEAKLYNNVTVLFTDFVNFTGISERLSPTELVAEIHKNFTAFDAIMEKYGLEKIKTIGDAYLAVCGMPQETEAHARQVILAALEICSFIEGSGSPFRVRVGINSGPVVAGIVGVKKYAYDIWGDTVNTAARMEQHSEAGKINISGSTYSLVKSNFPCTYRGKIEAKNKGEIDMYFVDTLTLAHD